MEEVLTICSAKELEHFERIRQTFESVDKSKQDPSAAAPQTVAEAMEAFTLGSSPAPVETPMSNGDSYPGSIHDRIKGLKQWPGGMVRSASGHSTASSKGKGKGVAGRKGKASHAGADEDASVDGDEEDMVDGQADDDDDEEDYVVRTDHLANPMEEVE